MLSHFPFFMVLRELFYLGWVNLWFLTFCCPGSDSQLHQCAKSWAALHFLEPLVDTVVLSCSLYMVSNFFILVQRVTTSCPPAWGLNFSKVRMMVSYGLQDWIFPGFEIRTVSISWDLILACTRQGDLTWQALIYEWKRRVQTQHVFLRKARSF